MWGFVGVWPLLFAGIALGALADAPTTVQDVSQAVTPRSPVDVLLRLSTPESLADVVSVLRQFAGSKLDPAADGLLDFPLGAATPSEACAACHWAVYMEHAFGFGADLAFKPMPYGSQSEAPLVMPTGFSTGASAHHTAGVD